MYNDTVHMTDYNGEMLMSKTHTNTHKSSNNTLMNQLVSHSSIISLNTRRYMHGIEHIASTDQPRDSFT